MDFLNRAKHLIGVTKSSFGMAAKETAIPHAASPDMIGVVRELNGEAFALSRDQSGRMTKRPIHSGDLILKGEVVENKANSFLSIALRGDIILSVGPQHKIDIEARAEALSLSGQSGMSGGKLDVNTRPVVKAGPESPDFYTTGPILGVRG